ncbi:MAG: hypothetical protein ACRENI_01630 [Gemmatimonadaceae bacterium]
MAIIPLYGHGALKERLKDAVLAGRLPSSLLFHGPHGTGKQRLALWLGQLLLCSGAGEEHPCGRCQSCRYAVELANPDIHWFFPRSRLSNADAGSEDVRADHVEAIGERLKTNGLYPPPSGSDGIHVATVREIVRSAALAPALGRFKVFIIGDAERMASQEGSEQAANAFLKLLEEPPDNTRVIMTSSEPGALLPTIRSRVVAVRVPPLTDGEVRRFIEDPTVAAALEKASGTARTPADDLVALASGAPGSLLGAAGRNAAMRSARQLLDAATSGDASAISRAAMGQGAAKARGAFSDMLDAMTVLLHERARKAVRNADHRRATGAAKAMQAVERAKELAYGNVSPQLLAASLLRSIDRELR